MWLVYIQMVDQWLDSPAAFHMFVCPQIVFPLSAGWGEGDENEAGSIAQNDSYTSLTPDITPATSHLSSHHATTPPPTPRVYAARCPSVSCRRA